MRMSGTLSLFHKGLKARSLREPTKKTVEVSLLVHTRRNKVLFRTSLVRNRGSKLSSLYMRVDPCLKHLLIIFHCVTMGSSVPLDGLFLFSSTRYAFAAIRIVAYLVVATGPFSSAQCAFCRLLFFLRIISLPLLFPHSQRALSVRLFFKLTLLLTAYV